MKILSLKQTSLLETKGIYIFNYSEEIAKLGFSKMFLIDNLDIHQTTLKATWIKNLSELKMDDMG